MINPVKFANEFKTYNGNPNLKRSGVHIEWTPELVQEYVRCSQDPIYFVETYMKIVNVDRGLIPFQMYPYQKTMINSMVDNRYTIITTARQAGKSSTATAFLLWYVLFNDNKTVALLANKGETAREILGKVELAYQHLPKWLQQGVIEWNKGSLSLENGSRVIATATSGDSVRGYSLNLLFIDEAAFIENWDEFFKSTLPTISSGSTTKVILVSTPNGLNHFHAYWEEAKKGKNGYNPIQVMWYDVPDRNEKWKTEYLKSINNDEEQFAQEMCCEFHGSSGTLIAGWKLKTLIGSIQRPIAHNAGLYQYQKPIDGHTYACIVDVSHGKGLDHSAFHIIDITKMPYEQVCVYRNNTVAPFDYAETIFQIVKSYNSATILVEINDLGHQVADHLFFDFEYEGILFTQSAGRDGKRISTGFGDGNVDKGIRTTKTVKAVGCSILKLLIEQDQLIIHDHETIYELGTFSRKGKSYEAEPGKHDDLVMGLVLFAWLSDQKYFKDMTDIHTLTKLREKSDQEIMAELTPFGIMDDGRDEDESAPIEIPYHHDQWMS